MSSIKQLKIGLKIGCSLFTTIAIFIIAVDWIGFNIFFTVAFIVTVYLVLGYFFELLLGYFFELPFIKFLIAIFLNPKAEDPDLFDFFVGILLIILGVIVSSQLIMNSSQFIVQIIYLYIGVGLIYILKNFFKYSIKKNIIIKTIEGDNLHEFTKLINNRFSDLEIYFKNTAYSYLEKINNKEKINIICSQYFKTRHKVLIKLIIQKKWVATEPVLVKIYTILQTDQLKLLSNLNLEETIMAINAFDDSDPIIANNAQKMGDFLQDSSCKSLIYFLIEQWEQYEQIDFDQNILKNIFSNADSILRNKITEKIKISGRSDWLHVIFAQRKHKNIDLMTDPDWQVTVELLTKTDNDLEKWKLAQQAPPFYSQQLLKQIHSLDFINGKKSDQENLLLLGQKLIPISSDFISLINDNSKTLTLTSHTNSITSLVMNKEGTLLVSGSVDKKIKLWKLPLGKIVNTLEYYPDSLTLNHNHTIFGHTDSITSLTINNKGTLLVSGSADKTIKLSKLSSGIVLQTLKYDPDMRRERCEHEQGHTDSITSLVMNKEGTLLVSGSADKKIKLWKILVGRVLFVSEFTTFGKKTIFGHTDSITSLVMNKEGTLLVSGSADKTIKLWKLPSAKLLRTIKGHTDSITSLVMNKEGNLLVSGSADKTIKLWELPSGKLLHTVAGHTDSITSLVMNKEGTFLVSGSADKTIKLWELPFGRLLQTITSHTDSITSLVMNREGTLLASSSKDKTIKLWELYSFDRLPLSQIINYYDYIQDNLKRDDLTENKRNWFEFMLALVNNYRSFEIDIEDVPISAEAGEFDIEIE